MWFTIYNCLESPNRGILVKKVIFIEKGNTHVMPGHQEKNDVTIEIIIRF